VPLRPDFEHALIVLDGMAVVDGTPHRYPPARWPTWASARTSSASRVRQPTRAVLIGGEPFPEQIVMWWNFVARSRREIDDARTAWAGLDERFGSVRSTLPLIPAPLPFWQQQG